MYTLILTREERKAIDWIGHRYSHGDDLRDCLFRSGWPNRWESDWDNDCDIRFNIPEHVAWMICDIIEEGLDCFSPELCAKLHDFAGKVV